MNDRPLIGITCRTVLYQASQKLRPTETVTRTYVDSIERAGGLALLLPNTSPEAAGVYLDRIAGLLLTGGDDVAPRFYGEEPHPEIDLVDDRRDAFEIALLRAAHARRMPLLAVCRGVQILNVAFGGDLFQDIPSQTENTLGHAQKRLDDGPWHELRVEPQSLLSRLSGPGPLHVNSFHHQACRRPGKGLVPSARAVGDGLIEALEDPSLPFWLGVQWHPELNAATGDPRTMALFSGLVAAARERVRDASK